MKKALFISMALLAMVACNKEAEVQSSSPTKKSIPVADEEIHQTFLAFIAEHDEESYIDGDIEDLDYAIWLMEGALNVTNAGDGVNPNYIDPNSETNIDYDLTYTVTGADENISTTITKGQMHSLFSTLKDDYAGSAAVSDLEIIGDLIAGFQLSVTAYSAAPNPPLNYPCPADPIPSGSGGYACHFVNTPIICKTVSSTSLITDALTYQNQRHTNSCHLAYLTYGHTIKTLRVDRIPGASSLNWKLVDNQGTSANPNFVSVGTGISHEERLYGAANITCLSGSSPSKVCLTKAQMDPWVVKAQEIIDIEDPVTNTYKYFIKAWVSPNYCGNNQLYGYHSMFFRQLREMPVGPITNL